MSNLSGWDTRKRTRKERRRIKHGMPSDLLIGGYQVWVEKEEPEIQAANLAIWGREATRDDQVRQWRNRNLYAEGRSRTALHKTNRVHLTKWSAEPCKPGSGGMAQHVVTEACNAQRFRRPDSGI